MLPIIGILEKWKRKNFLVNKLWFDYLRVFALPSIGVFCLFLLGMWLPELYHAEFRGYITMNLVMILELFIVIAAVALCIMALRRARNLKGNNNLSVIAMLILWSLLMLTLMYYMTRSLVGEPIFRDFIMFEVAILFSS